MRKDSQLNAAEFTSLCPAFYRARRSLRVWCRVGGTWKAKWRCRPAHVMVLWSAASDSMSSTFSASAKVCQDTMSSICPSGDIFDVFAKRITCCQRSAPEAWSWCGSCREVWILAPLANSRQGLCCNYLSSSSGSIRCAVWIPSRWIAPGLG